MWRKLGQSEKVGRITQRQFHLSWIGTLLALSMLMGGTANSYAQEAYPTKPIVLVVTFAAGGGTDVLARLMAKYLSEELGQPVNVVNRPGGDSIPGILSVMNAAPDGYTWLVDGPATSSLQAFTKNLPYKIKERTWGPRFTVGPYIYAVNADSSWKTLEDMVEAARKDPESFRMAWLGGTSFTDTTLLKFLDVAGIDASKVSKVPYTGSGPAMIALAGGHIDLAGGNVGAAMSLLAAGEVRALAVTGDHRIEALPEVPSSKEAGFYVPLVSWNSISGPPGIPKSVLERIDKAVQNVTENPKFVRELAAVGNLPRYTPPEQMWPLVQKKIEMLRALRSPTNASN